MPNKPHRVATTIGGRELIIETGSLATLTNASVTVRYGDTVLLVTATMSTDTREDQDFFPLLVDYQIKTYAAGKIPGGFPKREGKPSDEEIVTCRFIDRPIRPLFPDGMLNDVQIIATLLSYDCENAPDVLALIGASAALSISDIPFDGPIGAVRVGLKDGKFVINPTPLADSLPELDIAVVGKKNGDILMLECASDQIPETVIMDAIRFARDSIASTIDLQEQLAQKCGARKAEVAVKTPDEGLIKSISDLFLKDIRKANASPVTEDRRKAISGLKEKRAIEEFVKEGGAWSKADVFSAFDCVHKAEVRRMVIEEGRRVEGRALDEVREISCQVGLLPRTHGSAVFARGHTQSLAVTTLGTSVDEKLVDALEGKSFKKFMLHYNFPPFSVGEVKPMRGPSRRDIGHGALAEKALKPVMPGEDLFPYTVRIVSDILESNASSSMASVCGATLSLMDAGVPIKAPVGGISMGLVKEGEKYRVLTDICGIEDFYGDMDFKIAGTEKGITAIQLDIKLDGLPLKILEEALLASMEARREILSKMFATIGKPRQDLSAHAPRITTLRINPDKIRDVIGPGGKVIRGIIEKTGVQIDVEDDGRVLVASVDRNSSQEAIDMIKALTEEIEVGKIYMGKVKTVTNFGAFVEVLPGQEGLVHVSELADHYVKNVEDVVKVGDEFQVKAIEIDSQGRIKLSRKRAMPDAKKVS